MLFSPIISRASSSSPSNNFRSNPYEILGVAQSATQKEIQQQYRSLCLKYHPDKNRENNFDEENDFAFKEVQHAYSLIGSEGDRRKYDISSRLNRYHYTKSSEFMPGSGFSNIGNIGPSVYFKFGDSGSSFRFYDNNRYGRRNASPFEFYSPQYARNNFDDVTRTSTKRTHYVQKVVVPLEKLYAGGNADFILTSSLLERYKAAYKGKILIPLIMQAALTILMTWVRSQRVNWALSILMFAIIVHANIPQSPMRKVYPTTIKRGWKAGTKLKYTVNEPRCLSDVTFIIEEGLHDVYKRVGDDLHATITVKETKLRRGCTVYIDSLSKEAPIKLKLGRREIKEDGQVVVIKGRGWPTSKRANEFNPNASGDLYVKIRIKA